MEKAFILTFFLVIVTVAGFSLDWIDCLPKEIPYSSVVNLQSEDKELEDCLLLKTNFKEIAFKMYQELCDNIKKKYPNFREIQEKIVVEIEGRQFFISILKDQYLDGASVSIFLSRQGSWVLVIINQKHLINIDEGDKQINS